MSRFRATLLSCSDTVRDRPLFFAGGERGRGLEIFKKRFLHRKNDQKKSKCFALCRTYFRC